MMATKSIPQIPSVQPGIYRHYKGQLYEVIGTGLHSESLETIVVYKPLYESDVQLWVRPYVMFIDTIEIDRKTVLRFEKVK